MLAPAFGVWPAVELHFYLQNVALRESMAAHSTAWERALVLAQHRLADTPRIVRDDPRLFAAACGWWRAAVPARVAHA